MSETKEPKTEVDPNNNEKSDEKPENPEKNELPVLNGLHNQSQSQPSETTPNQTLVSFMLDDKYSESVEFEENKAQSR